MTHKNRWIGLLALTPVIALVIALSGNAGARGGGHSSGAPVPPHIPGEPIPTYICSVEIDQYKGGESRIARIGGIRFEGAEFKDHGFVHWEAQAAQTWKFTKRVDFTEIDARPTTEEIAGLLQGASFSLGFDKDYVTNEESTNLMVNLARVRQGEKQTSQAIATAPIAQKTIKSKASFFRYRQGVQLRGELSASVEVTCERVK